MFGLKSLKHFQSLQVLFKYKFKLSYVTVAWSSQTTLHEPAEKVNMKQFRVSV